jgi:hypothetical protein
MDERPARSMAPRRAAYGQRETVTKASVLLAGYQAVALPESGLICEAGTETQGYPLAQVRSDHDNGDRMRFMLCGNHASVTAAGR